MIYIQRPPVRNVTSELNMANRIIQEVGEYFGTDELRMRSASRKRILCASRMFVYYFMRKYTSYTYFFIGALFNRDHSTVMVALNELSDLCETDDKMMDALEYLERRIAI